MKEEKLQQMVDKAPFLSIEIIDGFAINKNHKIKINAKGMIESWRENANDHYVYFGSAVEMNGKIVTLLLK